MVPLSLDCVIDRPSALHLQKFAVYGFDIVQYDRNLVNICSVHSESGSKPRGATILCSVFPPHVVNMFGHEM